MVGTAFQLSIRSFKTLSSYSQAGSDSGWIHKVGTADLSCENREAVDKLNDMAATNGGIADINPKQDLGFMYNRNLADSDGHVWEMFWMDSNAMTTSESVTEK